MKYLINELRNWADEFEVSFYELLNEEDYQKYMYCKKKLGKFESYFYFGTNEGWEDDEGFDYLDFNPIKISDDEARIIEKYFPGGEQIFEHLIDRLEENYDLNLYNLTFAQFKDAIDKINQENDNS